jgi:hypothetical protein
MTEPILYRILDSYPYLEREDEYSRLTLEEAAVRMDDLTGVGEDVILADWDERCQTCEGHDQHRVVNPDWPSGKGEYIEKTDETCPDCGGDGKWAGPWVWKDDETGREVTMMREVEP